MAATPDDCDEFMEGPLVIWLKSCLGDPDMVIDYNDLVDGVLLYQVLLQIDPEPTFSGVAPSQGNHLLRVRNLEIVLKNLRSLYEEEFNQMVIMVPNVIRLGTECYTEAAKHDLNLLLLLLLACAVQCPNKEIFIERIKELPLDVQHSIVDHIKQFTDTPLMVLGAEQEAIASNEILLNHVRHLVKERNEFLANWINAAVGDSLHVAGTEKQARVQTSSSESHHFAVELADWKSKLRKQRQELEEKTESLNECKDELEVQKALVSRLRQEVADVVQDARSAKAYRDELDVMREKAERAEKLETELERFKSKLRDVDFFKTRVEELRDDNRVLMEMREMLEGQLERAQKRGDRVLDLEAEILRLKQQTNELCIERDAKDRKLEELYAEQAELQMLARCARTTAIQDNIQDASIPVNSSDHSLSSQLTDNAKARALRLELENHRLQSVIENLRESALHESNAKLLETEQENKRMAVNMIEMEEQNKRLAAENKELETLVTDALQESRKLQESREGLRSAADNQQIELQKCREELEVFKRQLNEERENYERVLPRLKELETGNDAVEELRERAALVPLLREKMEESARVISTGENQILVLQKEISRLKEVIEESQVRHDELLGESNQTLKEKDQIFEELKSVRYNLADVEKERDEVLSRAHVSEQALQALQTELVQQKVDCQNLKSGLIRLGLSPDFLLDPNITLADLLTLPELKARLPVELQQECQQCLELANIREDIARQQVLVTTLQSQINSLSAQHTAVQLANTQLAAEKEALEEERKAERAQHEQLLRDQTSLQHLHEQLTSEHDTMLKKQETLKQQIRQQQREIQTLREAEGRQEAAQDLARAQSDELHEKTTTLKNLRDEHSKLRSDFRELFSAQCVLKEEYTRIQTELKASRAERLELQMLNGKLKEELTSLSDNDRHLQMQLNKLTQANAMLEEDRRSVMDHASILLAQYQELFTHSLEDNSHYHAEEKQFADRFNEMRRQKEKLEEKIMDLYRRLDSTSSKKKGFGANLVRKVRKAGSELMNRSRRSLHDDSRTSVNIQGSESGENESDASFEDPRQEEESGPLPRILKQQGAGTRQTVYEADAAGPEAVQGTRTSLTVINRLNTTTTVIGERAPASPNLSIRSQPVEEGRRKTRKDDIYFDYGCV